MSAELIAEARTPVYASTSDEAWGRGGVSPADRDGLVERLADTLEAAEAKIQHALGVLYAASIPLGMTEAMFYQSLMRKARGILLERGDES